MKASLGGKNPNCIFSCYWGKWVLGWHSYFSKPACASLWPSWDLFELRTFCLKFILFLFLKLYAASYWEGGLRLQMECLPRLFLELCLLEEISIPHSIFRDNHDWISYLVFQLMQISSRYHCLSLIFLSFSFFFFFWWIKSCWIINFQPQNSLLILRAGVLVEKTPRHEWQTSRN